MSIFSDCLAFTLKEEGGFSNNPNDPGGATMCGVTLNVYRAWKNNQSLTPDDLKNISQQELSDLYSQKYWVPSSCDKLPIGISLSVFDMSVNAGVGRSIRLLQSSIGAISDGSIGPQTLSKVASFDATDVINKLADQHTSFYKSLPAFKYFGKGWLSRVDSRKQAALDMVTSNV